jgi:transcriptional regulator with XRE-family HTH domain
MYRARLGWNQIQMAEQLGNKLGFTLNQMAISKWERGVRTVPAMVIGACQQFVDNLPE